MQCRTQIQPTFYDKTKYQISYIFKINKLVVKTWITNIPSTIAYLVETAEDWSVSEEEEESDEEEDDEEEEELDDEEEEPLVELADSELVLRI